MFSCSPGGRLVFCFGKSKLEVSLATQFCNVFMTNSYLLVCRCNCQSSSLFLLLFTIVFIFSPSSGLAPYAGMVVSELLNKLKEGSRLEKPRYCSDVL